jgi:hypothetical protein
MTLSGRWLLAGVIVALIGAAVAAGLVLVGSPAEARLQRLDDRRVDDLTGLANAIDLAWTRTGRLPGSLDEAAAGVPPHDPDSAEPYAYREIGRGTYELCATFARPSEATPATNTRPFWTHTAGRQCFTIDAQAVGRRPEPR